MPAASRICDCPPRFAPFHALSRRLARAFTHCRSFQKHSLKPSQKLQVSKHWSPSSPAPPGCVMVTPVDDGPLRRPSQPAGSRPCPHFAAGQRLRTDDLADVEGEPGFQPQGTWMECHQGKPSLPCEINGAGRRLGQCQGSLQAEVKTGGNGRSGGAACPQEG